MMTRPGSPTYAPPPQVSGNATGVDAGITSITDLLNIVTANLNIPTIKIFVEMSSGETKSYILLAETGGLQPADFNPQAPRTWFQSAL